MHGINVIVPSKKATMYIAYTNGHAGVALYEVFFWDKAEQCIVPTDIKNFYRVETMLQLPFSVDNQHECAHYFCDGTLNPILGLKDNQYVGSPYYNDDYNTVFQPIRLSNGRTIRIPASNMLFDAYGQKVSAFTSGITGTSTIKDQNMNLLVESNYVAKLDFSNFGKPAPYNEVRYKVTSSGYCHQSWGGFWRGPIQSHVIMTGSANIIEVGEYDSSSFLTDISSVKKYLVDLPLPRHALPENLTDRIYDKLIIPDVNNIENILSIKGISEVVPKLKKMIAKHNLISLAEFYLFWKYEVNTTNMDLKAYIAYFHALAVQNQKEEQIIHLTCNDSTSSLSSTHYTISLPTYNSSFLESVGLTISSPNVWDSLPASFIVDWFIGIGDVLSRLHADNVLHTFNVYYCTISTSTSELACILDGPFKGSCVRKGVYFRTTSNCIPTPDVDVVFKNPIRHIFDGSALIIANKRH